MQTGVLAEGSILHAQALGSGNENGPATSSPSIDLYRKMSRRSLSLGIRATARMGTNARCVDIAAHRHLTQQS